MLAGGADETVLSPEPPMSRAQTAQMLKISWKAPDVEKTPAQKSRPSPGRDSFTRPPDRHSKHPLRKRGS